MRKTSAGIGALIAVAGVAVPMAFAEPPAPRGASPPGQGVYMPGAFALNNGDFLKVSYPKNAPRANTPKIGQCKQERGGLSKHQSGSCAKYCWQMTDHGAAWVPIKHCGD